ncbi:TonB-dependent receptor [Pseudomaricurvus alkylphenolicus]|uniref:TonB-dependent receptor n=1 Tax=Pseudomaricurvus alkylphenolicus TaxID=1306991 RepID=UPI00141E6201|nr:TonB-dependent receptor [Pseudomaricurvus alkylphenolicus]NIB43404.1 TonB-dependent receptor [Pseudomaricurvus alkylphenolicus]
MKHMFRKPLAAALAALMSPLAIVSLDATAVMLEEITVTAQKRDETLSDVPISISVMSQDGLDNYQVDDLFDVANFVPGMVFSRAPDDGLVLSFRGVASVSRNQAYEQAVGVFLDGVFFGKGRLYSAGIYDLERTEMIMGTQSTLLGKNTSVGAISLVTKKPGDEFGGYAQFSASEHGGYSVKGAVDIPASERVKFRLAGYYSELEGATKNIETGNNVPIDDNYSLRFSTRWDVSDDVGVDFMFQTGQDNKTGDTFQIDADPNGLAAALGIGDLKLDDKVSKSTAFGPGGGDSSHDTDSQIANLVVTWDLANHQITSQSTYASYDLAFFDDVDLQPGDYLSFIREEEYSQFSQEFRIASTNGETLDYMAGIYYFSSDWESEEVSFWGYPGNPPVAVGPLVPGDLFNGPIFNTIEQDVEYLAMFVSGTWHISEQLRLAAGLRYAEEEKDAVMARSPIEPATPAQGSLFAPYTFWNTVANPPFAATPLHYSEYMLNGNLNLQYDLTPDSMLYASYGNGTKTGGFAESNTIASGNPELEARLDAETVDNYEIGLKSTLLGGAAQLNVALFYIDIADLQKTLFTGTEFVTGNADADSSGVDISGNWRVNEQWSINAGAVYADAKEKESGLKLDIAPQWTANLGLQLDYAISSNLLFGLSGNLRYRSGQYSQPKEGIPEGDSLTTLDVTASLSSADETWKLSLIGRNVNNDIAQEFGYPFTHPAASGVVSSASNALRTYLVQFTYNF